MATLRTLIMSCLLYHYLTMATRHVFSPRRLAAYWWPGGAARRGLYGAVNLQDSLHYQATPEHSPAVPPQTRGICTVQRAVECSCKPLLTSHRLTPAMASQLHQNRRWVWNTKSQHH